MKKQKEKFVSLILSMQYFFRVYNFLHPFD